MKDDEKNEIANEISSKVTKKIIYGILIFVVTIFLLKMCFAIFIGNIIMHY
jgi:hypothetical protein